MVDDAPESTIRVMPHEGMQTLELELATCIPCAGCSDALVYVGVYEVRLFVTFLKTIFKPM